MHVCAPVLDDALSISSDVCSRAACTFTLTLSSCSFHSKSKGEFHLSWEFGQATHPSYLHALACEEESTTALSSLPRRLPQAACRKSRATPTGGANGSPQVSCNLFLGSEACRKCGRKTPGLRLRSSCSGLPTKHKADAGLKVLGDKLSDQP